MTRELPFATAINYINVALGKQGSQTCSTANSYTSGAANLGIDGNTDGIFSSGSVTHTNQHSPGELPDDILYWKVDLAASYIISQVKLYN